MSTLTKDLVDEKWKEMATFEDTIPGIRYGGDFPEFALAVAGSKALEKMVNGATVTGLLNAVLAPRPKPNETEEERKADLDKFMQHSPLRDDILRALYLGYKLGKGESQ